MKKTLGINEILRKPCHKASSSRGAAMGRRNQTEGNPEKLHLQRMEWVDGDYDTGGAYWGNGSGQSMWCAYSPQGTNNPEPIMVFVRGRGREDAKNAVLNILGEKWSFFR